jgi:hypothetical protein
MRKNRFTTHRLKIRCTDRPNSLLGPNKFPADFRHGERAGMAEFRGKLDKKCPNLAPKFAAKLREQGI